MADLKDFLPADADGIRWRDTTTSKGGSCRVGFKPTKYNSSGSSDSASVNWPPATDGQMKPSGLDTSDIPISEYNLQPNPGGSEYDWKLSFVNTGGWGFAFTDESPDTYTITTILNGEHYIQYSSPAPTIVQVQEIDP